VGVEVLEGVILARAVAVSIAASAVAVPAKAVSSAYAV
jgi:hypothetical protein